MPEADKSPRVVTVIPSDVPSLVSAMSAGDRRAGQLLPPVLKAGSTPSSRRPAPRGSPALPQGRGSTCSCCGEKIRGPFATTLIYAAGSAEPSLAAAICADCAGTAEDAAAAGGALARRMWEGG